MVGRGHEVDVVAEMATDAPYIYDDVRVWPYGAPAHDFDPDIIVSHLGDQQYGTMFAHRRGLPSVRMVHGHVDNAHRKLDKYPTALAVYNSQASRDAVGWRGRGVIVHPPTDPARYRTKPGRNVTLINLSPEKGGVLFWLLTQAMPETRFLAVRGDYGDQVAVTEPNVEEIVSTSNMARDVYSKTRILLIPSIQETWGRVGLEAMMSGIPVIAHPTPGLVESLGGAAVFADRDDLDAWVAAIRDVKANWAAHSKTARAHAERFDHRLQLERFATAVETLVPYRPGHSRARKVPV